MNVMGILRTIGFCAGLYPLLVHAPASATPLEFRGNPLICPIVYQDRGLIEPLQPMLQFDEQSTRRVFASEAAELKRFYLPQSNFSWDPLEPDATERLLAHLEREPTQLVSGLLPLDAKVRQYLSQCPHRLSSNRSLGKGPPDFIVPHAAELYRIPNSGEPAEVLAITRFYDRSFAFEGEYVSVSRAESCPAAVTFASGTSDDQHFGLAVFRNQLYLIVGSKAANSLRFMNRPAKPVDGQNWLTTCYFLGVSSLQAFQAYDP